MWSRYSFRWVEIRGKIIVVLRFKSELKNYISQNTSVRSEALWVIEGSSTGIKRQVNHSTVWLCNRRTDIEKVLETCFADVRLYSLLFVSDALD